MTHSGVYQRKETWHNNLIVICCNLMMGPKCSLKWRCATFRLSSKITVAEVNGKSPTASFHIFMRTYLSDMHIEVLKNACVLKSTHVCTFQSPPTGKHAKDMFLRGMWNLVTEVNAYLWTLLFSPHLQHFEITQISDKAITPGDNHMSFETSWQL